MSHDSKTTSTTVAVKNFKIQLSDGVCYFYRGNVFVCVNKRVHKPIPSRLLT